MGVWVRFFFCHTPRALPAVATDRDRGRRNPFVDGARFEFFGSGNTRRFAPDNG